MTIVITIDKVIGKIEMNNGVIMIRDDLQAELNSYDSIKRFPSFFSTASLHPAIYIANRHETGRCGYATDKIGKGSIISFATGSRISRPLRYSRQINDDVHVIGFGAIDHDCIEPAAVVEPLTNNLVAARDIKPGERITFNYLTTEYEMAESFACRCGHEGCYNMIRGFKYLSQQQRIDLLNRFPLADYLLKYINAAEERKAV